MARITAKITSIARMAIQAPWVNFVTRTTTSTARRRPGHEVHPRRLDRHPGDAGDLRGDACHPDPLRPRGPRAGGVGHRHRDARPAVAVPVSDAASSRATWS